MYRPRMTMKIRTAPDPDAIVDPTHFDICQAIVDYSAEAFTRPRGHSPAAIAILAASSPSSDHWVRVDHEQNLYGRLVLSSYDVAEAMGRQHDWAIGSRFIEECRFHFRVVFSRLSEIFSGAALETLYMSTDGAVYWVRKEASESHLKTCMFLEWNTWNAAMGHSRRAMARTDGCIGSCEDPVVDPQVAVVAVDDAPAAPVPAPDAVAPSEPEDAGATMSSDQAPEEPVAPPMLTVCPGLVMAPHDSKLPAYMQDSARQWANLTEGLPLLGDPAHAEHGLAGLAALKRQVPWMSDVIDIVEERMALLGAVGRSWTSLPPILVRGPLGIGKSYFAMRLAKAIGLGFAETSLSGSTDNREMEGTSKGYINPRPSFPVVSISRLRTANPLLFVDEIDKVDSNRWGDPRRTILTMIDGDTGSRYPDVGLSAVCDLSKVSWLFACNDHQSLETALMDRLEVVVVKAPDAGLLPMIAENVIRDMAASLDIERTALPDVDQMMVRRMEDVYSKDQSLRKAAAHLRRDVSRMASSSFRSSLVSH